MYTVCIPIIVSMYLYSYPSTDGIYGLAAGGASEQFEVRLKMTIKWTRGDTPGPWSNQFGDALWRPWLSELGDVFGGRDRATLMMRLQSIIGRVLRYSWTLCTSVFGNALGGRDRASLEMPLEAAIKGVCRCNWKPRSSDFEDTVGGCDRARLEMHLQAMIQQGWTSTGRQSMDGTPGAETLFIS
jgi:hypothetical protein